MAYSPPAGNSVTFNFTVVYAPPAGASVTFNFGFNPPPGGSSASIRLLLARQDEDDRWINPRTRQRFGYPTTVVVTFRRRQLLVIN